MYRYKTKDGRECFIPGVGQTQGRVVESPVPLDNNNLELIADTAEQAMPTAAPVQPTPQYVPQNQEQTSAKETQ